MSGALKYLSSTLGHNGARNSVSTSLALFKSNPGAASVVLTKPNQSNGVHHQQVANIVRTSKMEKVEKPAPFPYKTKKYTQLHVKFPFLDFTQLRMDSNSKIIVVEGGIASGKEKVAQELAKEFGMLYVPEPQIDDLYVNNYGFDYRTLNQYIHPKLHAFDDKMFYEDPEHPAVSWYKILHYRIRYTNYIDVLAHLFNTGQGLVLERSPHSDMVFTEAMFKTGFLPKDTYDFYYRLRYNTVHKLLRPHLIVYLDIDPDLSQKRVLERNIPYQVNSKVLKTKFLEEIINAYKNVYLEDASKFSELLIFKWNQGNNVEEIVNDIEKLNMDDWDYKASKFRDWNFFENYQWDEMRYSYTRRKNKLVDDLNLTLFYDVDSLETDGNDCDHREEVYNSLVPQYCIQPDLNPISAPLWKRLLGITHWRREQEFELRGPFY